MRIDKRQLLIVERFPREVDSFGKNPKIRNRCLITTSRITGTFLTAAEGVVLVDGNVQKKRNFHEISLACPLTFRKAAETMVVIKRAYQSLSAPFLFCQTTGARKTEERMHNQ